MNNQQAIINLNKLYDLPKFIANHSDFYSGLEEGETKEILTNGINKCVQNFIQLVENNAINEEFLNAIKKGLEDFDELGSFDTEEREQICRYFEQIMDAIGMESSNGLLNTWMYGFDV